MFCDVSRITPDKKIHLLSRVRETIGHTNTKISTTKKNRDVKFVSERKKCDMRKKKNGRRGGENSEFRQQKKKGTKIFQTNNRPQSRARAISANHPSSDKK